MFAARTSRITLQWGHAFVSVETFHGAVQHWRAGQASMGPRFCKRGNALARVRSVVAALTLQWGHAFVSVETNGLFRPRWSGSMLQWGHAFVSVETGARRDTP